MIVDGVITELWLRTGALELTGSAVQNLDSNEVEPPGYALRVRLETQETPPRRFETLAPPELTNSLRKLLRVGDQIRLEGTGSIREGSDIGDIEFVKLTKMPGKVIPWTQVAPELRHVDEYA